MVDSLQSVTQASFGNKAINSNVPLNPSINSKGKETNLAVHIENEPKKLAQPPKKENLVETATNEKTIEIKVAEKSTTDREKIKDLIYSRYYEVEDSEFVLKVYDNQGRLVNKIPPGYLTLKDRDIVNLYA